MKKFLLDNGSVVVLLALCVYYSVVTLGEQHPVTVSAGHDVADAIVAANESAAVIIITRDTEQDRKFADAIRERLEEKSATVLGVVHGDPRSAREALEMIGGSFAKVDAIATNQPASAWGTLKTERLEAMSETLPSLKGVQVHKPASYVWPSFLTRGNLINVVNQNADIAIIAIGMTMIIITAGIDLSVGSLLAISAVMTAVCVQEFSGGSDAGPVVMIAGAMIGIGLCVLVGVFNGLMVTVFRIPAFVVTLAMMMIGRGMALIIAVEYQSYLSGGTTEGTPEAIRITSDSFSWLGNGEIFGLPNPIILMIVLYIIAHITMTRTSLGRYIYAVGGNPEAARLSGVPVFAVLIFVYAACGAMAGLAGVVDASRFDGGRPKAGELYELQVIAAVVVGGTSLAGGEGRIMGTLIGAMIIAVIQNGLNMAGVTSFEQMVVFGALILVAVLADQLKRTDLLSRFKRPSRR